MQIPGDTYSGGLLDIEAYRGRNDPEAVKAVSREMEALFVNELLKVMRESVDSAEQGSLGGDTYMSMFDMEVSRLIAERGIGIQQALSRGLAPTGEKATAGKQKPPDSAQAAGTEMKPLDSPLPDLRHLRVTSAYGPREDPFGTGIRFHHGVDLAAPAGTPVHCVRQGTVVFSGEQRGYGNVVIVDHGDGFTTTYAHNRKNLVSAGDRVEQGSVLAQVGSTGRSTGPHLHFSVNYRGREADPGTLLAKG